MLHRIALLAIAAPRRILAVAILVMMAAAVFGIPVAKSLSAGGFQDPNSESSQAGRVLTDKFGQGDMQMLVTVTSPDGIKSPHATAAANDIVNHLKQSPHVANVTSAWTVPPAAAAELTSKDGTSGLIIAAITGGENDAQKYAKALSDDIVHDRDGVTVRSGGIAMVYAQITDQTQRDLLLMESIAIPLSFVVLVWVFGGLVAAALPMAVGGLAIVGSMSVLRLVTFSTDVSIFALNLTTALGLAMAIDYTLLIISRFRDELASGAPRDKALVRTIVDGRAHGVVRRRDGRVVDGRDAALSHVLPEVLRVRGHRDRRVRGSGSGDRDTSSHLATWRTTRRPRRPQAVAPHHPSSRARAEIRRADLLVPLHQDRHASRDPRRVGGRRPPAGAGCSVPQRQVGFPR